MLNLLPSDCLSASPIRSGPDPIHLITPDSILILGIIRFYSEFTLSRKLTLEGSNKGLWALILYFGTLRVSEGASAPPSHPSLQIRTPSEG